MNGPSPQRRPRGRPLPAPREQCEEGEGYAWNHYGRDTLPDDLDPCPVRPPPRERRRRPDGNDGGGGR
ncbi:MAG: hypothetical protein AB7I32_14535 [Gammaproteobacteria bacterium]